MKIVHIGGGLGNQLADYFNYLAVVISNPDDYVYIETLVYDIPECGAVVSQWNGYELERVFDLNIPNVKELFSKEEWNIIVEELRDTKFWVDGWKPRNAILQVLNNHGCDLECVGANEEMPDLGIKKRIYRFIKDFLTQKSSCWITYSLKNHIKKLFNIIKKDNGCLALKKRTGNYYYTPSFEGIKSKKALEVVGDLFANTLIFKPFDTLENLELERIIKECNSVAIHARRSDYLKYNEDCYTYGYFKKAVSYIRNKESTPVFIIFSEECDWCKRNIDKLGLKSTDQVYFVDWNLGKDSYRDLQLMSLCKHKIITKSSFGYLACLLRKNKDGITCSQMSDYLTTVHF